jgi:hypothetical protein
MFYWTQWLTKPIDRQVYLTGNVMVNKYYGSCLCGRVSYEVSGDFDAFYLCHCSRCQKDTGSAHAANLFAKAGRLVWLKGEADVTHYQYSGSLHTKSFCQCCGSALPTVAESIDCVVVPAGSLDTPISVTPTAKIFVADCAAWSADLSNVPSFDALPE